MSNFSCWLHLYCLRFFQPLTKADSCAWCPLVGEVILFSKCPNQGLQVNFSFLQRNKVTLMKHAQMAKFCEEASLNSDHQSEFWKKNEVPLANTVKMLLLFYDYTRMIPLCILLIPLQPSFLIRICHQRCPKLLIGLHGSV